MASFGRTLAVTLFALALTFAQAAPHVPDPYCDDAYLFFMDAPPAKGTGNWESVGKYAAFRQGPCTGVSGISMTQTYLKSVLVIDRSASDDGHIMLTPEKKAYAQEVDIYTGAMRPLDMITNAFCSSAQHFPDGTIINVGGDYAPDTDYVTSGGTSIRSFTPCADGVCDFKIVGDMTKVHWYPTTQLLPDGRMIIIGGATGGLGINSAATNIPYIEYYPKKVKDEIFFTPFLVQTLPYNLFPFCHLLPSGLLFIFSGNQYILYNTLTNKPVPGRRPKLAVKDALGNLVYRQYPLSATSAMFPIKAARPVAEIMICGGNSDKAQNPLNDNTMYPADNNCWTIIPEAPIPVWKNIPMKYRRVMPMAINLPDGQIMIHGGAMRGHTGFWKMAFNASLVPELYDTTLRRWNPLPMPASRVQRGYHASAQLIHDGAVMISGSNTADGTVQGAFDFPTEFRVEYFDPPYRMPGTVKPILLLAPKNSPTIAPFLITFKYPGVIRTIKVVLAHPGFATHGANHGMRNVELAITGTKQRGIVRTIRVSGCPNKAVCPPTWYWLFVVVNGIPNEDGHYIFVK